MEAPILDSIKQILNHRRQTHQQPTAITSNISPNVVVDDSNFKLGASYNIFDGEELLEQSIRSVRPLVSHVVVVYQTHSNFGEPCSGVLLSTLEHLQAIGLVDEIIQYDTRFNFTKSEKKHWVSARATGADLGGARYFEVADPFFNEISKRELGRVHCLRAGCSHFMCMDTDEFYKQQDLTKTLKKMIVGNYDAVVCKMRFFFKFPRCELYPFDEQNYVASIFKLNEDMPLRLAHPYTNLLIDPTRRMFGATKILVCLRKELEMYHYSFVRLNILSKLINVTNRGNYSQDKLESFVHQFPTWTPDQPLCHPHPYFAACFKKTRMVPNWFNIQLESPYAWDKTYQVEDHGKEDNGKEDNGKEEGEEEGGEHRAASPLMAAQEKLLKQSAMEHFKDRRFEDAGDLYLELSRRAVVNVKRKDVAVCLNTRLAYLVNAATCRLKQKRNVECVELCTQALDDEEASVRLGNGGMTDGTRAKSLYTRALSRFSNKSKRSNEEEKSDGDDERQNILSLCTSDLELAMLLQKKQTKFISKVETVLKKVQCEVRKMEEGRKK